MSGLDVSIIVPVHNRASLIGATLDSLLAQSVPALEIIVVDDGSTDGTSDLLATYTPRVRVIRLPKGGPLIARNVGVQAALGRLVGFCDSDDLWQAGFIEEITKLWEYVPDLRCAFGNFRILRDGAWSDHTKFDDAPAGFWDGMKPVAPGLGVFQTPIIDRLLQFQPFFPSAMMVERDAFLRDGGWDDAVGGIIGSDFATALRCAEQPIGIVRAALVGVRKHGGNLSGDVQVMNLGNARILEHCLATRPKLQPHRAALLASVADRRAAALDSAFVRRDFPTLRAIAAVLPPSHLPARRRLKVFISKLPQALAERAANVATEVLESLRRRRARLMNSAPISFSGKTIRINNDIKV